MPITLLVPNVRNMTAKSATSFWLVVKSLMLMTLLAQKGSLVKNTQNQSELVLAQLDQFGSQIKDRMVKIVGSQLRVTQDQTKTEGFGEKRSIFGVNNPKKKQRKALPGEDSPHSQNSSTNESFNNAMFNSRKSSQNNLTFCEC